MKAEPGTVSCRVGLGTFSFERAVVIPLVGGQEAVAVVDQRSVKVSHDPKPGAEVDGQLKVYVVDIRQDSIVIDLPQPTFTTGPRVEVPRRLVTKYGRAQ